MEPILDQFKHIFTVFLPGIVAEKFNLLIGEFGSRFSFITTYLIFLLLVLLVGCFEGSDWRRDRVYAGYHRLVFISSVLFFLTILFGLTGWILFPDWVSIRGLILALMAPAFALGWAFSAGRPVFR